MDRDRMGMLQVLFTKAMRGDNTTRNVYVLALFLFLFFLTFYVELLIVDNNPMNETDSNFYLNDSYFNENVSSFPIG